MNKLKIFKNNLNNHSTIVKFNIKKSLIGKNVYLPSFSKEWKNTVYSFDKNTLSNIPTFTQNINTIFKSYFNLFFKDYKDIEMSKFIMLKRRRNLLRRIFISNSEIKHTNDKMIITLYTLNRERDILKKKYFIINKKITIKLLNQFFLLYKKNIGKIYKNLSLFKKNFVFVSMNLKKKSYIQYKLANLNKLHLLKDIYLRKIWSELIQEYIYIHLRIVRKYNLLYSLNVLKFNKLSLLAILSNILKKIIPKKIEYNIINLNSFSNSTDIFTNIIALKLKRKKIRRLKEVSSVLNRTGIRKNSYYDNFIVRGIDIFKSKYKDLRIISYLKKKNNLNNLLNNTNKQKNIKKHIWDSIKYKNISGIRIEVKGRLTKRYRADRSVYSLRWKGGLKNSDSSFRRISNILWRGNTPSHTDYSISTSKRRIGAFAVKGWIGGK